MKPRTLVLIEYASVAEAFYPFTCLHCVWELWWGPFRLLQWWRHRFPEARLAVVTVPERELWRRSFEARYPEYRLVPLEMPLLLLNAQLMPCQQGINLLEQLRTTVGTEHSAYAVVSGGTVWAAWVDAPELPRALAGLQRGCWDDACAAFCAQLPQVEAQLPRFHYLWDVLARAPEAFAEAETLLPLGVEPELWQRQGVWIRVPEHVWIDPTAELSPGVVVDARGGPVFIGNGAVVQPHVALIGPCAIGAHALLRAHATVGSYTVVGEHCRIGGEVAHSVFHAYANKQHEGFVGHSYIGEWVNFGAGTTTSNLKNTYGTVRVRLPGGEVDTGMQFLGTLCGDHTKTAIGTFLRTGAVIGVSANVLSGASHARWVPSFSWGDAVHPEPYALEKALEVARRVMARRGKTLLPEEEALLRHEYARSWANQS